MLNLNSLARRISLPLWFLSCVVSVMAQTAEKPVRAVTDPGVVTTRQTITPAGVQAVFHGRVYGLTFGASSSEVWVLNAQQGNNQAQIFRFDWAANKVLERIPIGNRPGLQGIQYDRAADRVLIGATLQGPAGAEAKNRTRLMAIEKGTSRILADNMGSHITGALAIASKPNSQGQRLAVVPLIYDNRLAIVDLNNNQLLGKVATGIAPFGASIDSTGTVAYVTNWGGRVPQPNDSTLPTGFDPKADQVVVDERGIASTGTVTRIDLISRQATHTIPVELHPTAIVWDEQHNRLYVANGNKDSVSIIDTTRNNVIETITIQPFQQRVAGIAPTALAVSADGSTLYVACGGINAVAVIDTGSRKVQGLVPTAWYPNALSISADGKQLAVSTLLGAGSGWRDDPAKRFVHAYRGSISVVPVPDEAQLDGYTTAVAENNHLTIGPAQPQLQPQAARDVAPMAIPRRAGEPSLIEHVVYIIKENRTYDQLLGDMTKGNGDPSLVMFGEDVTPNHHRLADQFVLLDNFYATGGNSGDGHQWATQANETAYCLWPGYLGRSYPFDGSDPIAYADSGFIWDAALRMKRTVRVYGEYAGRLRENDPQQRAKLLERWKSGDDFTRDWNITAPLKPLNKILAANYPSYTQAIPDVVRAQIFLADLKRWEGEGRMPNLVVLQLPSDHTRGATPDFNTAKAMVADNDLALGQIVESLSKTPFWRKMAIFVVEDDAQNGVDHVDGHRTVALAVSPYTRRGHVDSTFYSQPSILKTIELILGLPTMSLFDLIANDMRGSFTNAPDFMPYAAQQPKQSLFETNPQLNALRGQARRAALDSLRMRFDVPDAVPTERLNRILWHQVKGWKTPYPGAKQGVFAPLAVDLEDDERGAAEDR
ncbi:MAG: bifunctional YncE family protein/alkaline phosphatase family protein [Pyrinomonadaceae bacterium]|nr:bifunctional YncE family protein/alkaline phosphatase family protein [Pyrinomonadaceae bacterium]